MITLKRWCVIVGLLMATLMLSSLPSTLTMASDTVWTSIAAGIDYAMIPAPIVNRIRGEILVVRIDPGHAIFRLYYKVGERSTIQQWAGQNPGAAVIINANFMRSNGKALGLVRFGNDILSEATGRSGNGQFEINAEVPTIDVISRAQDTNTQTVESYMESFEGYPLLLLQGKQIYQPIAGEKRSRRSVIAQDDQGRILLIVTKPIALTLREIIDWCQSSNLGIVSALNLDGGSSSQIYLAGGNIPPLFKRGNVAIPVVLAIYPR